MKPVKIIGGRSMIREVSLSSDEFTATANSDEKGKITCRVKRHSSLSIFLYRSKLPIPRLAKLLLLLTGDMTKRAWEILSLLLLCVVLSEYCLPASSYRDHFFALFGWYNVLTFYIVTLVIGLIFIRKHIANWHGAEHMAIAAYERTSATDIQGITQESPIHDKCGGRLLLPLLVGMIMASFIAKNFAVSETIVFIAILECLLWVDKLIGWDKIPLTSQASRLLQKWVTTRYPGEQELKTAQCALQELVNAHKAL